MSIVSETDEIVDRRNSLLNSKFHSVSLPLLRLNRLLISFSHGAEWNRLISRYIGAIPVNEEGSTPQTISILSPLSELVKIAMAVNVGAAAIPSHTAMRRVSGLRRFGTTLDLSA